MSQSPSNYERLQAAGAISGDTAALRPVLDGLSEAEVGLLLSINEKVTGTLPEVEEHEVIGAGIF